MLNLQLLIIINTDLDMKKFYTLLGGIALAVAVMTPGISAQSMPGYSMLKYTISPADGSDVNELETIIIDFPDPVDGIDAHILTTSIGNYATLTCGSTVIKAINLEAGTHGSEISKAYIYFPKTTTPGTYTFLPKALFAILIRERATTKVRDTVSILPSLLLIPSRELPELTRSRLTALILLQRSMTISAAGSKRRM